MLRSDALTLVAERAPVTVDEPAPAAVLAVVRRPRHGPESDPPDARVGAAAPREPDGAVRTGRDALARHRHRCGQRVLGDRPGRRDPTDPVDRRIVVGE